MAADVATMSALTQRATKLRTSREVGFVPEPEVGGRNSAALRRQLCLTAHRFVHCRRSICLTFIKVAPRQLLFNIVNIQQLANFMAWLANEATSPKRCGLHFL
jgi:hypothetical protein